LCALGVVTCIASVARPVQCLYLLAGALGGVLVLNPAWLMLPWSPLLGSEPAQVSLLLFMLAFARVIGRVQAHVLLSVAGVLAVIWLQALGSLGYPASFAWLIVLLACFTTVFCSLYRAGFRTETLLEEAFLIVMLYALALAIVPEVLSGWDAAVGLQNVSSRESLVEKEQGGLWLAAGFVIVGAAYAKWKRYRNSIVK
jgi:hypothetical protein